jgi:hypothetical protein
MEILAFLRLALLPNTTVCERLTKSCHGMADLASATDENGNPKWMTKCPANARGLTKIKHGCRYEHRRDGNVGVFRRLGAGSACSSWPRPGALDPAQHVHARRAGWRRSLSPRPRATTPVGMEPRRAKPRRWRSGLRAGHQCRFSVRRTRTSHRSGTSMARVRYSLRSARRSGREPSVSDTAEPAPRRRGGPWVSAGRSVQQPMGLAPHDNGPASQSRLGGMAPARRAGSNRGYWVASLCGRCLL